MNRPDPDRTGHRAAVAGGRLWPIVRGYIGACFVSAWALPLGQIGLDALRGRRIPGVFSDFGIVVGGLFIVILISAAPLATAAIIATEGRRVRSPVVFIALGALIATLVESVTTLTAPGRPGSGHWSQFIVVAIAGAIGGTIYFLLAVRNLRPPHRGQGRI
jgi:hypothetical protein